MSLDFPKRSATENLRANYPTCEAKWDKHLLLFFKGGKEFYGDVRHKKTPADAVLITFLNLVTKWAPVLVVSGVLLPDQRWKSGHAHRNQGKVPSSKMLAQKQMLITRIAGANKNR